MKKAAVSILTLIASLTLLSAILSATQLVVNWGVWRDTGRQIEVDEDTGKAIVKYYDAQMKKSDDPESLGADTASFSVDVYMNYIEKLDRPKMFLTRTMLKYFGGHKHWCLYPATEAATTAGWAIVLTILAIVTNAIAYSVRKRVPVQGAYQPALTGLQTGYLGILLICVSVSSGKPFRALILAGCAIIIIEVIRFNLYRRGILNGPTAVDETMSDDAEENSGRPRRRSWWRRAIGRFRR